MKLSDLRRCGLDTETTGPDPLTARIVTAALVFTGGGPDDRVFTYLINPGVDIPTEASDIHGVTTEMAKAQGQDPTKALDDLATKLTQALLWGMPLIAFNAAFDWTVLHHDLVRNGLPTMAERMEGRDPWPLLDPFTVDKALDRYRRGSRKLGAVCEHYGVTLKDWHTAEADATAAIWVMDAITDRYPDLLDMPLPAMFAQQQAWAWQQATSLQEYFRSEKAGDRYDPNAVVDGSWPLKGGTS